jgi:PDZ domain-containing protein
MRSKARPLEPVVLAVVILLAWSRPGEAVAADAPRAGVGILIGPGPDGQTVVQSVLPGGPADRAGIKTGDVLLSANGTPLSGLAPANVVRLVVGPLDTNVELRVRHAPGQEATLSIKRAPLQAVPAPPAPEPPSTGQAKRPPGVLKLHKAGIRDELAGMDAYQLLVPEGWQADGGVLWRPDRPAVPADITVRVRNPRGPEELAIFPSQLFNWSPLLEQAIPRGQKYLGCEVVRPVDGPLAALKAIVLPRFRTELRDRLRIVAESELPRLAKAAAPSYQQPGVPVNVRAGRIRIEYPAGDRQFQEDLTCVFFAVEGPSGVMWAVDQITSARTERGKLDEERPLFETVLGSARPNLEWFDQYMAVSQILVQGANQTQAQVMERARIQRAASQHVSETIRSAYQARQATMDQVARNYDEKAVRGVQAYRNPLDGSRVEVPDQYEHVWTNPQGDYIYSNSPGYNPNLDSNLHWQELEKAR